MPVLKAGTLQFWGEWFGRPHDNIHRVVECNASKEVLKLRFNLGETLSVWRPTGCVADEQEFSIRGADRVLWEWFYYGRPRTPANLFF